MKANRRQFVKGLAGAALAAPMASIPWSRSAFAAGTAAKRAVFVYIPDGAIPELFHPSGTETNFTLAPMTSPLERVKQHCVFTRGLTMYEGGSTHEGGVAKVLTGNSDRSLDYFLGQRLGADLPFKSLHLGVGANFQNGAGNVVSYSPGNIPITSNDNPLNAFENLFGGGAGPTDESLATRRKRSILDAIKGDLTRLSARLGTNERMKLEQHTQSVREVEARILAGGNQGGACTTGNFNSGGFTVP